MTMNVPPVIRRVFVAGAGAWGTTVANLLAETGFSVSLWGREDWLIRHIAEHHENPKYLPGVRLGDRLTAVADLAAGAAGAQLVVYGIPAQSLRPIVRQTEPHLDRRAILVTLAKGIEEPSGARCSEIVLEETRNRHPVGVLAGPNIAYEVARKIPSKGVISSNNYRLLDPLKRVFSTPHFKIYENPDLVGTELGGALKNVFAIMAGIGDGLGFGVNTKAAIITRGLREMVKIGVRLGGSRDTFFGLSGIGDLMATSLSLHSRNRQLGEYLGRGRSLAAAEDGLNGRVAEGIRTTRALHQIRAQYGVDMPIADTLFRVLNAELTPREGYLGIWNPGGEQEVA